MGKNRNRRRRQQREEHYRQLTAAGQPLPMEMPHVVSPPVLRLVRSEQESLPAEPLPTGRDDPAVSGLREPERPIGNGKETPSTCDVVAAPSGNIILRRTFDAAEVNAILNHPTVFPSLAIPGVESFDMAPILADQRNVALMADGGAILFCWCEPGVYEVHTNFIKPERGAHGNKGPYIKNACLASYRWMFTHTDCVNLLTRIPATSRAAAIFAPLLGWVKQFERKAIWPTKDGPVDVSFWMLCYNDWVRKTPELIASGKQFHDHLELEFARHGRTEEQHADEDCHDQHVGAAVEMIRGGQPEKAVSLYNGWAAFAGYGLIALVSHEPLVLDIGNAVLQVNGDDFKVILVR